MNGKTIFVQNESKFHNVLEEAQRSIVDLKNPVNWCPDKTDFVWQRCETEVIGEHTREGLLMEGTSDNGTTAGVVDIQKGQNMINFFLHREACVMMLTIDMVEKCSGILF